MNDKICFVVLLLLCFAMCKCQMNLYPNLPEVVQAFQKAKYFKEQVPELLDFTQSFKGDRINEFVNNMTMSLSSKSGRLFADHNSSTCAAHVLQIARAITKGEIWAINFLDTYGKLPSGLFEGDMNWLGSFSQCNAITVNATTQASGSPQSTYHGKYCAASIYIGIGTTGQPMTVNMGMCVPDSCNHTDINDLVEMALIFIKPEYVAYNVLCREEPQSFDTPAICVLVLLSILAAVIVMGTICDIVTGHTCGNHGDSDAKIRTISAVDDDRLSQHEVDDVDLLINPPSQTNWTSYPQIIDGPKPEPSLPVRLLLCFSLLANGAKILSTGSSGQKNLSCVHGIRFISMSWVILGHTVAFWAGTGGLGMMKNIVVMMTDYMNRFSFEAILNATVSVDTFFLLSGTLASYLLLHQIKESGGIKNVKWWVVYLHRFWRLTPAYMLIIATYTTLFHYMGTGPYYPQQADPLCQKYWWTDLLYINNFWPQNETCIGWTWYLANDMQFFWISPFVVIALYYFAAAGMAIVGSLMLMNFIVVGVLTRIHNLPADIPVAMRTAATNPNVMNDMMEMVYMKPYCRVAVYAVGLALGYLLYRTEHKPKIHWAIQLTGWLAAFGCCFGVLYGLYDVADGSTTLSPNINAFYASVHRAVWALGVAWVIFVCARGYGGPINAFLSWSAFIPLSRLTYMAYLVHPIVLFYFLLVQEQTLMVSDINIMYLFLGHMVVSYGAAFVLSLAFEAPMIALEKVILPRRK